MQPKDSFVRYPAHGNHALRIVYDLGRFGSRVLELAEVAQARTQESIGCPSCGGRISEG
jgi:hypothetical protein